MLNEQQLAVLKADILADPILSQWAATGYMASEIADAYNQTAAPEWVVWKTAVVLMWGTVKLFVGGWRRG